MDHDNFVPARRAGLAGAAGLLLAAVSGTVAADDDAGDALAPSGPCCGNGPPITKQYGTGIQVTTPETAGPDFQFVNPSFGKKGKSQYYWVFVPDHSVTVLSYTGPGNLQLHFYIDPPGFSGIAFCVAPDYTLLLEWPIGHQPAFSTRPLGANE